MRGRVGAQLCLMAACLGLGTLAALVRRGDARRIDDALTPHIGIKEGGLARACAALEPRYVAVEAMALASLPGLRRRERLALLLSPALTGAIGTLLKRSVHRERPTKRRFTPTGDESFPSTHTAHAASLAFALATIAGRRGLGPWGFAVAGLAAGLVGIGRVREAAHWPTDVIAGFLVGTGACASAQLLLA